MMIITTNAVLPPSEGTSHPRLGPKGVLLFLRVTFSHRGNFKRVIDWADPGAMSNRLYTRGTGLGTAEEVLTAITGT